MTSKTPTRKRESAGRQQRVLWTLAGMIAAAVVLSVVSAAAVVGMGVLAAVPAVGLTVSAAALTGEREARPVPARVGVRTRSGE